MTRQSYCTEKLHIIYYYITNDSSVESIENVLCHSGTGTVLHPCTGLPVMDGPV